MKLILAWLALASIVVGARAQDTQNMPDMKVPAEMAMMDSLLGTWTANLTMYNGSETSQSKATQSSSKVAGGRYIQSRFTIDMGSMGTLEGLQLTTYDPDAKKWRSWWFDQTSSKALEMEGTFADKKMVLTSVPTDMPGSPGKMVMRATSTVQPDGQVAFLLEMRGASASASDAWTKLFEGTFTKGAMADSK